MQVMPISVLVEICKAIDGDEEAKEKAAEVMIPIIPPFSRNLSKVIMHISDTEVRRWALGEIKGVEHDHDNAG
jgi:hypothetical protein